MRITIDFDEELNKFLPTKKRDQKLLVDFKGKRSVKDLIQSLGVPQTEVGGIKVNNQWVALSYILLDGDCILVFPLSPSAKSEKNPLFIKSQRPENLAFICDVHLRKLARRLRLLGFDTRYDSTWKDAELADYSFSEKLILLTRDRGLLMRKKACRGMYISNTNPENQVVEIVKRLSLWNNIKPFSRCLVCNDTLQKVANEEKNKKTKLKDSIPPKVLAWADEFHACPSCKKIFWKGSHYKKLKKKIEKYFFK